MPEIQIDRNGVLKLLSNQKPGPDSIKPFVLKQLKMEIAPAICLLFEKTLQTLQTGQLPQTGKRRKYVSFSKSVTKQNRPTIGPSL